MKVKHIRITKTSRRFAVVLALLLALVVVVPVLAKYIGPFRTVTTYVNRRLRCHYEAVYDPAGPGYYSCTMNLFYPPGSSCPSNVAAYFDPGTCGWSSETPPLLEGCSSLPCSISRSSSVVSCTAGQTGCRSVPQEITYDSATISGNINCPQTGDNGYCTAAASLSLSGNEPLSGYHITGLEGTRNGEAFFCEGASCTVNLGEGANDFTFWALSDWGDSSLKGSASRGVDTNPPSISGNSSGTSGNGGWHISPVTVTASASDPSPGSGLASFQASVDGSWSAYSGPITLNDGSHTVELLARDNAGLSDSASMSFQIDTVAPTTIITNPAGATWATGTIPISGVSSDLNLNSAEISYNGGSSWNALSPDSSGNWSTNWNTQTVSNGSYSVRARGRDEAGNVGGAAAVTIMVDNGKPRIYIPDSWPIWQRVSINVVDNGIGVDRVRLTIHGGTYGERVYNWSDGPDDFKWDRLFGDIVAPIGGYPVEVEAWDAVGNKGAAWGEIVIPEPDEIEEDEEEPGVLSVDPPEEPPSEPPGDTGVGDTGGGDTAPAAEDPPAAPSVVTFGSEPETESEEIAPPADSSGVLWGAAAAAAAGAAMIIVTAAKKKREDEEKQKAAAAEMFNKQQIALEEKQAQRAAQRKWEAEQEAALRAEIKAEREAMGIRTGQPAPTYFNYVEAQKQLQREEDLRKRKEEEKQEQVRAQKEAFRQADNTATREHALEEEKSWWEKAIKPISTITGGYFGGTFGDLVPRVLTTVVECGKRALPSVIGYVHEDLWKATHNSNLWEVIKRGYAWLNPNKYIPGWDGTITGLGGTTQVQAKSIDPNAQYYSTRVTERAGWSGNYGPNQEMVVTTEATDDVIAQSTAPDQVRSSNVSHAEAKETTLVAQDAARGSTSSFLKLSVNMANKAAVKAGGIGALISGGISLVRNTVDVIAGRIGISTAVARTTVDTLGGTVTAAAGAWTGAMAGAIAGAALGSVIPVAGNIIGGIVGFGVGVVTSIGVGTLWNNHVREPLTNFLDRGLSAYGGIAQNAKTYANAVIDRASVAVSNAVETVKSTVTSTVSNVAESVSNFFGNIFG